MKIRSKIRSGGITVPYGLNSTNHNVTMIEAKKIRGGLKVKTNIHAGPTNGLSSINGLP